MIWGLGALWAGVFALLFLFVEIQYFVRLKKGWGNQEAPSPFVEEPMVLEKELGGNRNRVFRNTGDSASLVDHYILSREGRKTFLLCHYSGPLSSPVILEVRAYDKGIDLIGTDSWELDASTALSQAIPLPDRCEYVNLRFRDPLLLADPAKGMEEKRRGLKSLARRITVVLFLVLIPVAYLTLNLLAGNRFFLFMNLPTASVGLIVMSIACVLNYAILVAVIGKKYRLGR